MTKASNERYFDLRTQDQADLLRSLDANASDLDNMTSNNQRSKPSERLRSALASHITDELAPALQTALQKALPQTPTSLEISDDADSCRMSSSGLACQRRTAFTSLV